jgi:hypothetical protein
MEVLGIIEFWKISQKAAVCLEPNNKSVKQVIRNVRYFVESSARGYSSSTHSSQERGPQ